MLKLTGRQAQTPPTLPQPKIPQNPHPLHRLELLTKTLEHDLNNSNTPTYQYR